MSQPPTGTRRVSRRRLLKSAAVAAGAAAGSGVVTGFPMIWAQGLKDIKIVHVGQSYSTIQNIAKQATSDLGFTVEMQTVDAATQVNRLLSQPQTIDITDFGPTSMKYFLGRNLFAPIPVAKYKWWDKTVPLFTSGKYPDGRMASMQGYAPIKTMYYT